MKAFLYVLLAAVVLLVAAVLLAPSLVDWNAYRGELAAQVQAATGREVVIDGDMNLELLPAPALSAADVRLANVEGGSRPHMVALESLRVRVALAPLLQGRLQVESLTLVRPEILLEVLADGRRNWDFAARTGAQATDGEESEAAPFEVRVDSFVVRDGTVIYRDARSGWEQRAQAVDAELVAESLRGPFAADGTAELRGTETSFDIAVGRIATDGATPFNATLGLPGIAGEAQVSGALSLHAEPLAMRGSLKAEGESLAAAIRQLTGAAPAAVAARPFLLSGDFTADAEHLQAKALELRLGEASATAELDLRLGTPPTAHVSLAMQRLELDRMLDAAGSAAAAAEATGTAAGAAGLSELAPPQGVEGTFELAIEALVYRGQVVRQARLDASLADGVLTVEQALALLPGSSDVAVSGKLARGRDGPTFDGRLEAASDNLRAMLAWLGADVGAVPADRLRRMSMAAQVSLTPELLQLTDIDLDLDVSEISGGIAVALRRRPGFGIGLTVDKLSLDGYLPRPRPASRSEGAAQDAAEASPLAVLDAFDANFDLRVGALAYHGTTARDLRFEATLNRGDLTLRQLSIGDLGQASLDVQGQVTGIAAAPAFDGAFSAEVPDVPKLAERLGLPADGALARLGRVSLAGEAKGTAEALSFEAALQALDGRIAGTGELRPLAGPPRFDLELSVEHPELAELAARLGAADGGRARGAVALSASVSGTPLALRVRRLTGRVGPVELGGRLDLDLAGPRPKLAAELETGALPLAALGIVAAGGETRRERGGGGDTGGGRWSHERIELAGLDALDAELALRSEALVADELRLEQATLDARLAGGVLTVERLNGTLFDGTVKLDGRLDGRDGLAAEGTLQAVDVDARQLLARGFDFERLSGPLTVNAELRSRGASEAELVAGLNGEGTVSGRLKAEVEAGQRAAGALLGLLGEKVEEVRGLAQATTGVLDAFAVTPAELDGSFRIDDGVLRTRDTRLRGKDARLAVAGTADLPVWRLDMTVDLYRDRDASGEPYLTALLRGPLDRPNPTIRGGPFRPREQAPAEEQAPQASPNGAETEAAPETPQPAAEEQPPPEEPAAEMEPPPEKPKDEPEPPSPEETTEKFIKGILDKLRD